MIICNRRYGVRCENYSSIKYGILYDDEGIALIDGTGVSGSKIAITGMNFYHDSDGRYISFHEWELHYHGYYRHW